MFIIWHPSYSSRKGNCPSYAAPHSRESTVKNWDCLSSKILCEPLCSIPGRRRKKWKEGGRREETNKLSYITALFYLVLSQNKQELALSKSYINLSQNITINVTLSSLLNLFWTVRIIINVFPISITKVQNKRMNHNFKTPKKEAWYDQTTYIDAQNVSNLTLPNNLKDRLN